jgi:hypothetical protein
MYLLMISFHECSVKSMTLFFLFIIYCLESYPQKSVNSELSNKYKTQVR